MSIKRRLKYILPIVAALLVVCVLATVLYKNRIDAEAGVTLPGIEAIVNSNTSTNPYVIIEVVADKNDAKLGFLVGGEEPVYNGKSLRDMPLAEERNAAMAAFGLPGTVDTLGGAFSYDTIYDESGADTANFEIRGSFYDYAGGDYYFAPVVPSFRLYDPATDDGATLYKEFMDFKPGSSCSVKFGPINDDVSRLNVTIGGNTYPQYYRYEVSAISLDSYTVDALIEDFGQDMDVYQQLVDGGSFAYQYVGSIDVSGAEAYIIDKNGVSNAPDPYIAPGCEYYIVYTIENRLGGDYVVTGVEEGVVNGNFDADSHFEQASDGNYVMIDPGSGLTYDPSNGDKMFSTDYSGQLVENFSYSGGLRNEEWLKRISFDIDAPRNFVLDVKTVTMDEFKNINLEKINMVYFREGAYTEDMEKAQAQNLMNQVISNKMPVIFEKGFDSNSALTYNHRISVLLQNNLTALQCEDVDAYDYGSLEASKYNYANGLHVSGSVLVSNGSFVASDFLNEVAGEYYNEPDKPLYPVYAEILSEDFYRRNASKPLLAYTTVNKATALRYIVNYSNQRVVIKSRIKVLEIEPCYSSTETYSIGGGGENDLLRVRDVERNSTVTIRNTDTFRHVLSPGYIAANWATQFEGNDNNIELVQTYTKEFIGKVEDLNENYDLIYIGLDTSTMNTHISNGVKYPEQTLYNDSGMNGLIYSHMGDYMDDNTGGAKGFGFDFYYKLYWNKFDGIHRTRTSGNDITKAKYDELIQYLDAGYPIVLADRFFKTEGVVTSGVNTEVVDSSSHMCKFVEYAIGHYAGKNLFSESEINGSTDVKKRLSDYLNISKLTIEKISWPQDYKYNNGSPSYLSGNSSGVYNLEYTFTLKNDAAVDIKNTKYDVKLYIDSSVDGRYTAPEEVYSLIVKEAVNGEWIRVYHNSEGKFELTAGKTYSISRQVPPGYTGVLPWKLVFTQNDNQNIRKSWIGYTAVPVPDENRTKIHVLQITDYNASGNIVTNLNLKDYYAELLLDQIQDFDIEVEQIPSNKLVDLYSTTNSTVYYNYLKNYDMLILGFSDLYRFGEEGRDSSFLDLLTKLGSEHQDYSNAAAEGIKKYIESGKSVLFTHDTTSYFNYTAPRSLGGLIGSLFEDIHGILFDGEFTRRWGYEFNQTIRFNIGMDRYNATGDAPAGSVYDDIVKDNYIQGYSDGIITRCNTSNSIKRMNNRPVSYVTSNNTQRWGYTTSNTYQVSAVNDGQILHYPFEIDERFSIANTHSQYYQLNMDTNPTDPIVDDDIVVWYTISDIDGTQDNVFKANPKDVRNNYYIYNRGNVTYSGAGHSAITTNPAGGNDLMELKLFINTIVAAYSSGIQPPTVTYTDGQTGAVGIKATYIPFDYNAETRVDTPLDNTPVEMYFEISDSTIIQGTRELIVKYYIDENGTKRDITNQVKVYRGNTEVAKDALTFDTEYTLKVPVSVIQGRSDSIITIYISAETIYHMVGEDKTSGVGYFDMNIIKTELFDLD